MDPIEIAQGLSRFEGRAAGTDAERRAALWLRERLRGAGRDAELETEWVRPQWPWVHAGHALAAVAGGLLAISQPLAGLLVCAAALISCGLDLLGGPGLLRRLTPERATQNLVSGPTESTRSGARRVVRLVIVAGYDTPRGGVGRSAAAARLSAALQRVTRGLAPGALGTVALAVAALTAIAAARLGGVESRWLELGQLVPSLWLLGAAALLIDAGLTRPGDGSGNAAATAVSLSLATALDRAPPRHLAVELILAGAADGPSLGMRAFVRRRRRRYAPTGTAVLHLNACARGRPTWWTVDGPLLPRRLHPRLASLAAGVAVEHPQLGARSRRGHSAEAAWRARLAGWPAITVGCVDEQGVPGAGGPPEPQAMRDTLAFCRELVDALDADIGRRAREHRPPDR
jgi:hypothetical protein